MEPSKIEAKHRQKGKDSFKTKFNLLLFHKVIKGTLSGDIYEEEFEQFKITSELSNQYATQYYQYKYSDEVVKGKTVRMISNEMVRWKKEHQNNISSLEESYLKHFSITVFPLDKFKLLYDDSIKRKCHYCQINEEMVNRLIEKGMLYQKRGRGFNLEIDRKKPNQEYTPDNSVLCCYWCNNAKTDEFCDDEFKDIGVEIGKIWQRRLLKKPIN